MGRIDQKQLDYLRERGIGLEKAQEMLVLAKLKQALKWVEKAENREKIEEALGRIRAILSK